MWVALRTAGRRRARIAADIPDGFLWGAATAAHQVEGDNRCSNWWACERRPGTPVAEPSGTAIEHHARFERDIALAWEDIDGGVGLDLTSASGPHRDPLPGRYAYLIHPLDPEGLI
jgi:hypothetical protein